MLEGERSIRRHHVRSDRIVRHRQDGLGHAQTLADLPRDFGQRGTRGEALPSIYVQREVVIAEAEPGLQAEPLCGVHEVPALVAPAPTGFEIGLSGERIDQRVHVRRNVEAEVFEVVSGVDDKPDLVGFQHLRETQRELGAANAAGEREYLHRGRTLGVFIETGLPSGAG